MREEAFDILLIDHVKDRREQMSSRLRSQGYCIDVAAEGFQAISLIENKESNYDLLIAVEDFYDMSNLELFSLIRTRWSEQDLPIIFLTEEESPNAIMAAIEAGANEIVKRNNDLNYLFKKIRLFLLTTE